MRYSHIIPYMSALPNPQAIRVFQPIYSGWRWMLSPVVLKSFGVSRHSEVRSHGYACDNGAYAYYRREVPFDSEAFLRMLSIWGEGADWVVLPDVVGDWDSTLELASSWYPKLLGLNHLLLVAQDGCELDNYVSLRQFLQAYPVGLFVGGTTEFKLSNLRRLSAIAQEFGVVCHVGRVNAVGRMLRCIGAGATSFDGSGPSLYSHVAIRMSLKLSQLELQLSLFGAHKVERFGIRRLR